MLKQKRNMLEDKINIALLNEEVGNRKEMNHNLFLFQLRGAIGYLIVNLQGSANCPVAGHC